MREVLKTGHGFNIVPVADAWLIERNSKQTVEWIRLDWFFQQ
jgi:hypothetical protein